MRDVWEPHRKYEYTFGTRTGYIGFEYSFLFRFLISVKSKFCASLDCMICFLYLKCYFCSEALGVEEFLQTKNLPTYLLISHRNLTD